MISSAPASSVMWYVPRSAATSNHENYVVVDDPKLVEPFSRTFEQLWKEFA